MNPAHGSHDYRYCMTEALKDCNSVLEPGCQFGWQMTLVNRPVMVGVEVHLPYLQSDKVNRHPNFTFINADARKWMKEKADREPKSFDAVMMIDFIEHFEKPEAVLILSYAERIARKKVWLWVPEGDHMHQNSDEWHMGADYWQTHRSMWSVDDLRQLGYDTALWPNHHRPVDYKGKARSTGAMFALKEFFMPEAKGA